MNKKGFICKEDWDHHLEEDPQGVLVYPNMGRLMRYKMCAHNGECDVVELEIRKVKTYSKSELNVEKLITDGWKDD